LPDMQQLVKWALDEQTKDTEVLKIQTAKEIVEMVWGWSKLFMGIAGAATALFVLALAVVGYKSIADINQSRTESQAAIKKAQAGADKSAGDAKESIKEMKTDLKEMMADIENKRNAFVRSFEKGRETLDGVDKQLPALTRRIDDVTNRLNNAEPKLIR